MRLRLVGVRWKVQLVVSGQGAVVLEDMVGEAAIAQRPQVRLRHGVGSLTHVVGWHVEHGQGLARFDCGFVRDVDIGVT